VKRTVLFVVATILGNSAAPAQAQSLYTAPSWKIDGSLDFGWTNNALSARQALIGDEVVTPLLRLVYAGRSAEGLAYTFYVRGTSDIFGSHTADNGLATAGAILTKPIGGGFVAGFQFDAKLFYDGFFHDQGLIAYDLTWFVTKIYVVDETLTIVPRFNVGRRWADISRADRSSIDLQLAVEKALSKQWALVHIGKLQVHWYDEGAVTAPIDILPTAVVGLRYTFNENLSITPGVTFVARRSNIEAREFNQWIVGPSLEFAYKF
jgi:hypothetical protein